jgi:hypothetical protein
MSDLAHKVSRTDFASCVCGSAWNHLFDACSSIIPLKPAGSAFDWDTSEDWDSGYFECRKGHAFCARH